MSNPVETAAYDCPSCGSMFLNMTDAQTCCEIQSSKAYQCIDCGTLHDGFAEASLCCTDDDFNAND